MNLELDDREYIIEMVVETLIYYRNYIGQVVDNKDNDGLGKILVIIPELGFDTFDRALTCSPSSTNNISIPAIDSWVRVGFINGDRTRPIYFGNAGEIQTPGNIPKSFDGDPDTHILFESPKNELDNIKFSKDKELVILEGEDFAVKFNELKAAFDQLVSDFNTHIHATTAVVGGGGATGVISPTTPPSTADISDSKVERIKL